MIEVRNLSKHYQVHSRAPGFTAAVRSLWQRSYQTVRAVDDISFSIRPGERVGFLGPNGAGKTTTLKMLSGLLHPTAGQVSVGGFEPFARKPEFLSSIMLVMGQKQQLIWDLPPVDTFALNRAIYGVSPADYKRTLDELVDALQIASVMHKPTRQLSLGERMKCELAAALIHRPKVLFLDEPTIGLDVTMQAAVRKFVKRYNEETGATVLLTSHDMDDVAALCERILVIAAGKLVFDGSLDSLVARFRPEKRLTLKFDREVPRAEVERIGKVVEHKAESAVLQVPASELRATLERALGALPVTDLLAENAPLEDVFSDLFAHAGGAAQ